MFYNRVTQLCKESGTTVTALCRAIGIGTANGTYWKNGSEPSMTNLKKIADYFDVSTDYLLGKTDIKKLPSNAIPYEYFTHTKVPIVGRVAAGVSCPPNRTRK